MTDSGTLKRPDGRSVPVVRKGTERYPTFNLQFRWHGKPIVRPVPVHKFAAYQWHETSLLMNPEIEVRHLDGNVLNVRKDNIALGTAHDNAMDKPQDVRVRVAQEARAAQLRKKGLWIP